MALMKGVFAFVNQNYNLSLLVGLIFIFIQAMLFNRLCIEHDVIYTHSYLPAYFYMLISSVFPENLLFNPIMLINFAILLSFVFLFQLYRGTDSSKLLYYTGMFFGAVSVVMPVYYSGVIFLVVGTIIFKNITVKDSLGIISGYVFPAMIVLGGFFLAGGQYRFPNFEYKLQFDLASSLNSYLAVSAILTISVLGLLKTAGNYNKNNIKTRRITLLLVAYLGFSAFVILVKMEQFRLFFPVLTISLAVHIAYFLLGNKQKRWKEMANYLLIATVFYSLYGSHIAF